MLHLTEAEAAALGIKGAKRSKFGVAQKNDPRYQERIYEGILYASAGEAHYAAELDMKQLAGVIRSWSSQPRFPLIIFGENVGTYVADFSVLGMDGKVEIVDFKGCATPLFKFKWKVVRALYPQVNFLLERKS